MQKVWNFAEGLTIEDIKDNMYLLHFASRDDKDYILQNPPRISQGIY